MLQTAGLPKRAGATANMAGEGRGAGGRGRTEEKDKTGPPHKSLEPEENVAP